MPRLESYTVNIRHTTCRICDFMRHVAVFRIELVVLRVSTVNVRLDEQLAGTTPSSLTADVVYGRTLNYHCKYKQLPLNRMGDFQWAIA